MDNFHAERFVLFVGDTGAGKSKTINQLIGESHVLPSAGEGVSVTAAPVEMRYQELPLGYDNAPPGTVMRYRVKLEFHSLEEFTAQCDSYAKELIAYWGLIFQQEQLSRKRKLEVLSKAREKKAAEATKRRRLKKNIFKGRRHVQGGDSSDEDKNAPTLDVDLEGVQFFIRTLKPPTDADAKFARESHDWFEACFGAKAFLKPWSSAEDFRATFARPPSKFLEAQREFDCARQEEVGSLLKKWLVHNDEWHQTGQVWPLVRCAKLWGPWEILREGCVFVDTFLTFDV
jgi:hypothetical protein